MEEIGIIFLYTLSTALLLMLAGWMISLIFHNVTVVDSLWGLGFPLIAWVTFFLSGGYVVRKILITILVTIWGLRLSIYLTWRNWGLGEDPRYKRMRERAGNQFWIKSLYMVFLLQAVLMWLISLSLQYGQLASHPSVITLWDTTGLLLWGLGFFFQAVGDWQLAAFKANTENRGQVMNKGLWAYTRHPNYFGEALMWWGIFIITMAVPSGWLTIVSPVMITYLLLRVSGIPMTENVVRKSRPGYEEYIKNTSSFFPWFPRKSKSDQTAAKTKP